MEVRGKIHRINSVEDVSRDPSKSFLKRELVLLYGDNPMYPNYVTFEFTQDRVSMLDGFTPGEEVEVSFDLSGRSWTNPQGEEKFFNQLRAFMVKKIEVIAPQSTYQMPAKQLASAAQPAAKAQTAPANFEAEGGDDLPF